MKRFTFFHLFSHRMHICFYWTYFYCKLPFISSTGATFNQLKQAVQYKYRLYEEKRDITPNK